MNESNMLVSDEHYKCFKSLKASDYESYRDKHLNKRHGDTCSWVFSHQVYRSWLGNDDHSTLWIHGGPGFGKTVLSSVLTKELHRNPYISLDKDYSIAYHFCDGKDESLRTSYALLSNLLDQLLRQDPKALVHFSEEKVYMLNKETTSWDFDTLWRVFRRVVNDNSLRAICVIIDALGMLPSCSARMYSHHRNINPT
jgi:Cdc6-like AAA superfamily ATPase